MKNNINTCRNIILKYKNEIYLKYVIKMIDKENFDWQEYYDTHPNYQRRVDLLMDPREDYKYAPPPPLYVQIKEFYQSLKEKINKLRSK